MVRFLHTADWHLGIKFSQLGSKADSAREIRFQTAEKILKKGKESNVDFIIISGDLFDNNNVDITILDRVIHLMDDISPLNVYILPGNHDPLTKDSLYLNSAWNSLSNVYLFKNPQPLTDANSGAVLYPCPITQKQSNIDFTDWIAANNSEISVGVAHGNIQIEGYIDNSNFPIDRNRASDSNLNYLALGEWHSLSEFKSNDGYVRTVYPGTPESTKFGESNSGNVIIVDIESPESPPKLTECNVGQLSWEQCDNKINNLSDVSVMESELNNISNPQNKIISLNIDGVTDQETISYLKTLDEKFMDDFLYLRVNMDDIHLKPNMLELQSLIPEGAIVNKTLDTLLTLMKQGNISDLKANHEQLPEIYSQINDKGIFKDVSPEIINQAFLLLYQMVKEV